MELSSTGTRQALSLLFITVFVQHSTVHGTRMRLFWCTLPLGVAAWITTSQSVMGASLEDLRAMVDGRERGSDVLHAQSELGMLW